MNGHHTTFGEGNIRSIECNARKDFDFIFCLQEDKCSELA